MENNQILNTGAKGVFPGVRQASGVGVNEGVEAIINDEDISSINSNQPAFSEQKASKPLNTKTYFRMETENFEGKLSGILEIDLISFREKGEESRYVKFLSIGAADDGTQSETTISIDNEMDFNEFKKFVSELNWND